MCPEAVLMAQIDQHLRQTRTLNNQHKYESPNCFWVVADNEHSDVGQANPQASQHQPLEAH